MKYPRPPFGDASVTKAKATAPLHGGEFEVPVFDTPITPAQNFKLAAARQSPLWVPNSLTEFQSLTSQDVAGNHVRGMQIHSDFGRKATEDYLFSDWFGTSWTWVCSAGGAMLTPGTKLLGDITDWEKELVWPDFSEWGFDKKAEAFMREKYDPRKVMHYDLGRGCTERLVSLVGGYTDGMVALAVEPEAVAAFFDRYADFMIALFDTINALYPLDMVTYHDDWGTERDTFFSEMMFGELVCGPTKRIIDHVKSKGVAFEMHTCGNITRFMPFLAELDIDFLQVQRRAVDIPALKKKYAGKVGFNAPLEGLNPEKSATEEEIISAVRKTVDLCASGGGCYVGIYLREPRQIWTALTELYAYSRAFYDAERENV